MKIRRALHCKKWGTAEVYCTLFQTNILRTFLVFVHPIFTPSYWDNLPLLWNIFTPCYWDILPLFSDKLVDFRTVLIISHRQLFLFHDSPQKNLKQRVFYIQIQYEFVNLSFFSFQSGDSCDVKPPFVLQVYLSRPGFCCHIRIS